MTVYVQRFSYSSAHSLLHAFERHHARSVGINHYSRAQVEKLLAPNEFLSTFTNYPRLGAGEFLSPYYPPKGAASHSMFVPDEAIAPHARFP